MQSSNCAHGASTLRSRTRQLALLAAVLGAGVSARAGTFFWDPLGLKTGQGSTGAGTWDAATAADWYPGSGAVDVGWNGTGGGDIASFKGALAAGGATVTISGTVPFSQIAFQNTGGHYTLAGGTLNMITTGTGGQNDRRQLRFDDQRSA